MKDYKQLAHNIVENVGSESNISYLVHCVTRLRFNLKDKSLINKEALHNLNGVLGFLEQNGQFQVIIGEDVGNVYEEIMKQTNLSNELNDSLEVSSQNEDTKGKFSIGKVFDYLSGSFAPIVPAFAGAGILKGIIILLTNYNLLNTESGIYLMLNAASDATFHFLPFLLAYTASKKLNTNTIMSLLMAGIYLYPSIINNAGQSIDVFGINVPLLRYSATVLPILLSVWIVSKLHPWVEKRVVSYLRVVLVPVIVLIIMTPINLMIFGPIGYYSGLGLGKVFEWLFATAPWLGGLVDGATRPFVILTGMHSVMGTIMINNIETLGYDMLGPVHAVASMAAAGMCFGVFLRAKDKEEKATFFSSFISAFIGITEPALYGIAFRFKKPLYALVIGGGVAGALVAVLDAKALSFAMPSIISLPVYAGSIPTMMIGFVVAFVLTAFLAYVFSYDESIEKDNRAIESEKKMIKKLI
ncbi:PTS transporter subunit EIIC [Fundicoccus culcitae]|uniref:PTS transporter subunit EIIC n=1 Tax=Fundicoccus culcitae TaxID=2969821 RepID=A0ABY5P8V5_9LACT|nr:PTS transporter subunit EIIC [Fundicoccus culcitae]UUX35181.1 PTS transporter subunit EIIC [Fundicoccus culcitae]